MTTIRMIRWLLFFYCLACSAAEDRAILWGPVDHGLKLGAVVERDQLAVSVDTYLTNASSKPIRIVLETLYKSPDLVVSNVQPGLSGPLLRQATAAGVRNPFMGVPHVPPPRFVMLSPGESRPQGTFVFGPLSRLIETENAVLTFRQSIRVGAESDDSATESVPVELSSSSLVFAELKSPDAPEDPATVLRCVIIDAFTDTPSLKPDEALIRLVKDKTQRPLLREYAASGLAKLATSNAVETLLSLIADPGEELRGSATLFLARSGVHRIIPQLETLTSDTNEAVRAYATEGLGELGDTNAIPRLIQLLKKDSSHSVRENAVRSLSVLGGNRALVALNEAVRDEQYYNTTYNIILALGKFKDRSSLPFLVAYIERGDPPESSVAEDAFALIDQIAGMQFKGDLARIKDYLKSHPAK